MHNHILYKRILVPVDLDSCSEYAVAHGVELAGVCGGSITFLHVRALRTPEAGREEAASGAARVEQLMSKALEHARQRGVEASSRLLEGSPVEAILMMESEFDLIIMGTHGRHGADRLVLGSVSEGVLRRSDKPHLLLRCPPGEAFDLIDYYREVKEGN